MRVLTEGLTGDRIASFQQSVNFTGIVEGEKLAVPSHWKSNQLQQQFVGVIAKRDRSHVLLVQR